MTIKLAISSSSITYRDNKDILIHYNSMKPKHFGVLDILYCKEGGYIIIQPEVEIDPKSNINSFFSGYKQTIKRLRIKVVESSNGTKTFERLAVRWLLFSLLLCGWG